MCARDERTATENIMCRCYILQEKTQKNLIGGGGGRGHPPRLLRPRVSILVFAVLVTYCRRQRDYHFLQLPNQLLKGSLPPSLMMTTIKNKTKSKKRLKYSDFSHQKMAALKALRRSSCIYMQ